MQLPAHDIMGIYDIIDWAARHAQPRFAMHVISSSKVCMHSNMEEVFLSFIMQSLHLCNFSRHLRFLVFENGVSPAWSSNMTS